MTLRLRLFLLLMITYLIGGWLITRWMVGQLRPRYFEAIEETLVETSLLLSGQLESSGELTEEAIARLAGTVASARRESYPVRIFGLKKEDFTLHIIVRERAGRLLYNSEEPTPSHPLETSPRIEEEFQEVFSGNYGTRFVPAQEVRRSVESLREEAGQRFARIYVAAPIYREGTMIGAVSVGKSTDAVEMLLAAARNRVWWGVLTGGFVLLLALILGANWIIYPLERLATWARAVSTGKSVDPPPTPGRTLCNLREALSQMRRELAGHDAIDQYTRSLAHEIKAPLTGIRGAAEILAEDPTPEVRQRFIEAINRDSTRLQHLVDELLILSRLQSEGISPLREELSLTELCREAIHSVETSYHSAGITLSENLAASLKITGDRRLLVRALINLLDNARDFSPSGATVRLESKQVQGDLIVAVEDSGSGIPDYALNKVFERFFSLPRPDSRRKSTGLGLNLVREIMEQHGGEVRLANRPERGVRAELRWPGNRP
jgi:two-component system sensor histidine kinase CreC